MMMNVDMDAAIKGRIIARMSEIDALPADVRELVHEYGWSIVKAFRDAGVTRARNILHLVRMVQQGSAEGCARPLIYIDDAPKTLAGNGLAVIPAEPSPAMLAASLAEVSGFNVHVTKPEKHRLRLVAAIRAGRLK